MSLPQSFKRSDMALLRLRPDVLCESSGQEQAGQVNTADVQAVDQVDTVCQAQAFYRQQDACRM